MQYDINMIILKGKILWIECEKENADKNVLSGKRNFKMKRRK